MDYSDVYSILISFHQQQIKEIIENLIDVLIYIFNPCRDLLATYDLKWCVDSPTVIDNVVSNISNEKVSVKAIQSGIVDHYV